MSIFQSKMFKKLSTLFKKKKTIYKDYKLPHEILYKRILIKTYNNWFYQKLKISEDINGRFEIIVLHIFIIFHCLNNTDKKNSFFKKNLLETFIDELETTYREIGISDNTFSKKMKIAAQSIYGRLDVYSQTIENIDLFNESLQRNIWPLEDQDINKVNELNEYVYKKIKKYKNKSFDEIIESSKQGF